MKLFHAPASPFVRKVRITAMEKGLGDRIELTPLALSPVAPDAALQKVNPLAKIPALVTDDGETIYDSGVICAYLDSIGTGPRLTPEGAGRWAVLTLEALADGIADAAVLTRYETFLRPEDKRWPDWVAGQMAKVEAGLDDLERQAGAWDSGLDAGRIAVIAAIGYLDFRFLDLDWRKTRPALAAWLAMAEKRPSVAATVPSA